MCPQTTHVSNSFSTLQPVCWSTTYTTQTIFGNGAPGQVFSSTPPVPAPIPFEFSPSLGILLLGAWGAISQLNGFVQKRKSSAPVFSKD